MALPALGVCDPCQDRAFLVRKEFYRLGARYGAIRAVDDYWHDPVAMDSAWPAQ